MNGLDLINSKSLNKTNTKTHSASQIADVPDDEAVRIFLEFERVESAIKGQHFLVVLVFVLFDLILYI